MRGMHTESCVRTVELILFYYISNISYRRDGVDGFGQIQLFISTYVAGLLNHQIKSLGERRSFFMCGLFDL